MPKITSEDYDKIETAIVLQNDEDYSVVWHQRHGRWMRSIHVFARQPTTKEVSTYEEMASKLKFKGNKAQIDGSQTLAAEQLYNRLITRVYDLPIGRKLIGEGTPLTADEARAKVPVLVKKEAVRDFVGEVYSASRMAEDDEAADAPEGD